MRTTSTRWRRPTTISSQTNDRPTLIVVNSHIGYGSPHKQDTNEAHGEPLGEEEVRLAKKNYGWPEDANFLVPDGVLENFRQGIGKRGHELRQKWQASFAEYGKKFPELAGSDQPHAAPRTSRRMGQESADLPCRRQRSWRPATVPAKS